MVISTINDHVTIKAGNIKALRNNRNGSQFSIKLSCLKELSNIKIVAPIEMAQIAPTARYAKGLNLYFCSFMVIFHSGIIFLGDGFLLVSSSSFVLKDEKRVDMPLLAEETIPSSISSCKNSLPACFVV